MTTISPLASGINAYRDVASPGRATTGVASGTAAAGSSDGFTAELKNIAENWIDTLRAGEKSSEQAVAGQVDIREVVMAMNNAELTLQTAVAVRDKVIQAYQEIMRMPI
jgi:flagellar hook-basal body complex protein FliE